MAIEDYERFLAKVHQLNQLVELINNCPDKYQLFINCKTHKDIVDLAREWGYEIGKRWGES